ncbi:MAG: hypothetical protein VX794_09260 [Nitrospinota bacterium]|nr:hypothetical protein [Nitrospinota bacterium]
MTQNLYLEVEENQNSTYMPGHLYETKKEPEHIKYIKLEFPEYPIGIYEVTGWSSKKNGTPCPALYSPVSDSGQGISHLIYGGDWGIRFKLKKDKSNWDILENKQYGEPYLILLNEEDILL